MVPGSANKVVAVLTRFVPRSILLTVTDLYQKGRRRWRFCV